MNDNPVPLDEHRGMAAQRLGAAALAAGAEGHEQRQEMLRRRMGQRGLRTVVLPVEQGVVLAGQQVRMDPVAKCAGLGSQRTAVSYNFV